MPEQDAAGLLAIDVLELTERVDLLDHENSIVRTELSVALDLLHRALVVIGQQQQTIAARNERRH